jgi:predicted phosphodiesterase
LESERIIIKRGEHLKILLTFILLLFFSGCAQRGLISEKADTIYDIPDLAATIDHNHNPVFLVYGDTQTGWRLAEKFVWSKNWLTWKMLCFPFYQLYWLSNGFIGTINFLRYQPDYGIEQQRRVRDAILQYHRNNDLDFIVHLGDKVADGRYPSHWQQFFTLNNLETSLLSTLPYFTVLGNHEVTNDTVYGKPNHRTLFDQPGFYTLDFPGLRLIVVNSNFILDQDGLFDMEKQNALFEEWFISNNLDTPAWLQKQLSSRHAFKIVFMHHPLVSFGKHHSNWYNKAYGQSLQKKRLSLLRLFDDHDVDIVFSGHEHYYAHNLIRTGNSKDTLHQIIASAGGVPLRDLPGEQKIASACKRYKADNIHVRVMKQEKKYHYCIVKVGDTSLTVNIYGIDDDSSVYPVDEIVLKND